MCLFLSKGPFVHTFVWNVRTRSSLFWFVRCRLRSLDFVCVFVVLFCLPAWTSVEARQGTFMKRKLRVSNHPPRLPPDATVACLTAGSPWQRGLLIASPGNESDSSHDKKASSNKSRMSIFHMKLTLMMSTDVDTFCTFCKHQTESTSHLFVDCEVWELFTLVCVLYHKQEFFRSLPELKYTFT